jgi:uncharacterized protein with GYD domain
MSTYIILVNYTQQGIEKIKDSPKRLEGVKMLLRRLGGELKDFYLCLGTYDLVIVLEAPEDEAVAKLVLSVGSLGYVRTTTLKAFPEQEYREIIQALP